MEENLQKDNPKEHSSYFLKRKWWRPLYYVYFIAVLAGVIMMYSSRRNGPEKAPTGQAQAVRESTNATARVEVATNEKVSALPRKAAETEAAPAHPAVSTPTENISAASGELAYMMSPPDKIVDEGKTLFMNDCVACHGANGEGDGPAAAALNPKPRDFHSAKGWINGRMASGMFKTLTDGIPGSPMPPFSSISVKDRLAIISYIRTIKGFPEETKADLETLAKMVGKAGGSTQGND